MREAFCLTEDFLASNHVLPSLEEHGSGTLPGLLDR
jgi:hypothetical protein